MLKLILFRHGLSRDNIEKRYSGFRDTALHSKSGPQLKSIKNKLKKIPIDSVYCSDLRRSYLTAQIVFGERQCPIRKSRALRELGFGEWDGLTYKQVLTRYGEDYSKWLKNPFTQDIPRGEGMCKFNRRVKKALRNIISINQNSTVALVSHLGVLRVIFNTLLKIRPRDFWKLKLEPGAIYMIELSGRFKANVQSL